MNWTLVTAYVPTNDRSSQEYMSQLQRLTRAAEVAQLPQVTFLRPEMPSDSIGGVVPCRFEELYLSLYLDDLKLDIRTPTPAKDTAAYLAVQCHKTEWVAEAAKRHPECPGFLWVDASIGKFYSDEELVVALRRLASFPPSPTVRIPTIWPLQPLLEGLHVHHQTIVWYFAGGVFGGAREGLDTFARKMKRKTIAAMRSSRLTWEVNFWAMIYQEIPCLFDPYPSGHDKTLLERFVP